MYIQKTNPNTNDQLNRIWNQFCSLITVLKSEITSHFSNAVPSPIIWEY